MSRGAAGPNMAAWGGWAVAVALALIDRADALGPTHNGALNRSLALRLLGDFAGSLAQVDRDCFAIWFSGLASAETAAGELQAMAYVLQQELGDDEQKLAAWLKENYIDKGKMGLATGEGFYSYA